MGTEEESAESFCPTDEEIEKWMDRAFGMVGDKCIIIIIIPELN